MNKHKESPQDEMLKGAKLKKKRNLTIRNPFESKMELKELSNMLKSALKEGFNEGTKIIFFFYLIYFSTHNLIAYLNILNSWRTPISLRLGIEGLYVINEIEIAFSMLKKNGVAQEDFFLYVAIIMFIFYSISISRLVRSQQDKDWAYRIICLIVIYYCGHFLLFATVFLNNMSINVLMNFTLSSGWFLLSPVKRITDPHLAPNYLAFCFLFLFGIHLLWIYKILFHKKEVNEQSQEKKER